MQLGHLLLLGVANSIALFALSILLIRTLWCLGGNMTSIESWEIDRHESVLERSRANGGYVSAPGGRQIKVVRHEYPYDIGIWQNIAHGMGSSNVSLSLLINA